MLRLRDLLAARGALIASAAFTLLYALWLIFPLGGEEGLRYLSEVVFQFPAMAATGACAVAALRTAGRERLGWAAFAAGIGCWTAAEWIWSGYDLFFRAEPPLLSAAEPLYYLGYPFLMAGVALLVVPAPGSRLDAKSLVDALLLSTVLAVVAWRWFLTPLYEYTDASTLDVLVTFGYPVLDLALLAAIIFTFYRVQGGLSLPAVLLIAGALTTAVTDGVYLYLATVVGYDVFGNPLELGWVVSYFAFGLAAVARIEQRQREGEQVPKPALSSARVRALGLLLPYLALAPLLIFSAHDLVRGRPDAALSVAIIAALGLVTGRQFLTLRELADSREELQRVNLQLHESVGVQHHLARTDPLTGIPNRRRIDEIVDAETARACRYSQPLAVVVADLDDLKATNDTHGHPAGDEVLRFVAELARHSCRQVDVVGRYGGDEFVFVLPATRMPEATAFAERFRERLAEGLLTLRHGEPVSLTVSLGVAQWDEKAMDSPASLLREADRAMYAAKAGGRNRTMVADGETAHAA